MEDSWGLDGKENKMKMEKVLMYGALAIVAYVAYYFAYGKYMGTSDSKDSSSVF